MSELCGINGNGYYNWGDGPCFPWQSPAVTSDPPEKNKPKRSKLRSEAAFVKATKNSLVCSLNDISLPIIDMERPEPKKTPLTKQKDLKSVDAIMGIMARTALYFGKEFNTRDALYIVDTMVQVARLVPKDIMNKTVSGRNGTLKIYFQNSADLPWGMKLGARISNVVGFYSGGDNSIVVLSDLTKYTHREMKRLSMPSWESYKDLMLTIFFHELGHAIYFNVAVGPRPPQLRWYEQIPIAGAGFRGRKKEKDVHWFFDKLVRLFPRQPSFVSYHSGLPNGAELFADSFTYWAYLKVHGKTIDYRRASGTFPHGSCARAAVETLYTIDKFMASNGDHAFFENWQGPFSRR